MAKPRGLASPFLLYKEVSPLPLRPSQFLSLTLSVVLYFGAAFGRGVSPPYSTAMILVLRSSSSSSATAAGPEPGDHRYTVRV